MRDSIRRLVIKGIRGHLGVKEMFSTVIVVVVTQLNTAFV